MKKTILPLLLLFCFEMVAQVAPNKYVAYFKDKDNNPYSLADPSQFLSSKSLQRRANQSIGLEFSDLPVTPTYIDGVKAVGVQVINTSKWLNSVTFYTETDSLATLVSQLPYVKTMAKLPNPKTESSTSVNTMQCNDGNLLPFEGFGSQYAPKNTLKSSQQTHYNYGGGYNQVHMLNGDALHNLGYNGKGMVIAVLDAGFWHVDQLDAFDSLWDKNQILGTRDFVEPGSNVFRDDIHMHGMMVLSTMGANKPNDLVGTAPGASYWLIRTEDGPSENIIEEYNWVSGAEFADSVGADIINSSLGYTEYDNPAKSHVYADMDGNTAPATIGADLAARKGILVVNSAGNSAQNTWHYIGAPADGDSVFTIGAVDAFGAYASFSSTGPTADGRIKPNVASQGQGSAITGPDGNTTYGNGTSFSSPIMAGMVACLWQAHPTLKNMEIIQSIEKAGNQFNTPDSLLGYGIPDIMAAHGYLSSINPIPNAAISIYPNPFQSYLRVIHSFEPSATIGVAISNLQGGVVYTEEVEWKPVLHLSNFQQLAQGVYVLSLTSGEKHTTQKIIKL